MLIWKSYIQKSNLLCVVPYTLSLLLSIGVVHYVVATPMEEASRYFFAKAVPASCLLA